MNNKCDGTQWTTIHRRDYPKGSRVVIETAANGKTVVIVQTLKEIEIEQRQESGNN